MKGEKTRKRLSISLYRNSGDAEKAINLAKDELAVVTNTEPEKVKDTDAVMYIFRFFTKSATREKNAGKAGK